jgi:isochorismate pyruvate lyase
MVRRPIAEPEPEAEMKDIAVHAPDACTTMDDVRAGIDALDRGLVPLIALRQRYVEAAARIKQTRGAVRDEARIADVIAKVRASASKAGADPDLVGAIYVDMIERFIAHELAAFDHVRDGR